MKPAAFTYAAPRELAAALRLLRDDPDARILAGGQSLVPMMNFRIAAPSTLIDLAGIESMKQITVDQGDLVVGAGVTMAEVLASELSARWEALRAALRHVGHPPIRARGTVCGSLAHHDPTAELPAVAVALDATVMLTSSDGDRAVAAAEFFTSYYETALRPGEMIVAVRFPDRTRHRWGFREFARKRGDFALVGAVAGLQADDERRIVDARVVLFGVSDRPVRVTPVERLLVGSIGGIDSFRAALAALPAQLHPLDDNRATATLRTELAVQMSRDALDDAWGLITDVH